MNRLWRCLVVAITAVQGTMPQVRADDALPACSSLIFGVSLDGQTVFGVDKVTPGYPAKGPPNVYVFDERNDDRRVKKYELPGLTSVNPVTGNNFSPFRTQSGFLYRETGNVDYREFSFSTGENRLVTTSDQSTEPLPGSAIGAGRHVLSFVPYPPHSANSGHKRKRMRAIVGPDGSANPLDVEIPINSSEHIFSKGMRSISAYLQSGSGVPIGGSELIFEDQPVLDEFGRKLLYPSNAKLIQLEAVPPATNIEKGDLIVLSGTENGGNTILDWYRMRNGGLERQKPIYAQNKVAVDFDTSNLIWLIDSTGEVLTWDWLRDVYFDTKAAPDVTTVFEDSSLAVDYVIVREFESQDGQMFERVSTLSESDGVQLVCTGVQTRWTLLTKEMSPRFPAPSSIGTD